MLVDAHAHFLPGDYPADSPECFPRMEPIDGDTARTLVFGAMRFKARDVFFNAERRLAEQDASGVDVEVLSPMPPLLRYDLPVDDGISLARYVNESTAALCAVDPTRFIGLGMVPMQDPEAAAKELGNLREQGLHGFEVASNVLGSSIGDAKFTEFFTEVERLDLAVFVHAMPAPTERLPMSTMGTYVVGVEGAFAAGSIIAGGIAEKCPNLKISFSHGAGGLPLMLPRARYFWGGSWNEDPKNPDRAVMADDGPSPLEYARRFYYDSMVFDHRAIRFLVDLLGDDRLLVGSDFPAMQREEPVARTLKNMGLSAEQLQNIAWNNAFDWLGIKPTR